MKGSYLASWNGLTLFALFVMGKNDLEFDRYSIGTGCGGELRFAST